MTVTVELNRQYAIEICKNTIRDRIKDVLKDNRRFCHIIDRYNSYDLMSERSLLYASHHLTLVKNGLVDIDSFENFALLKSKGGAFFAYRQDYSKTPDYGGNEGRRQFLKKEFAARIQQILGLVSKNNATCRRWGFLNLGNDEVLGVVYNVLSSGCMEKLIEFESNSLIAWDWPEPVASTRYVFNSDGIEQRSNVYRDVIEQITAEDAVGDLERNVVLNGVNNALYVHVDENRSLTDDQSFEGIPELFWEHSENDAHRPDSPLDAQPEVSVTSETFEELAARFSSIYNDADVQGERQDVLLLNNEEEVIEENRYDPVQQAIIDKTEKHWRKFARETLRMPKPMIKRRAMVFINSRVEELFRNKNKNDEEDRLFDLYIYSARETLTVFQYADFCFLALYRGRPEFYMIERACFQD